MKNIHQDRRDFLRSSLQHTLVAGVGLAAVGSLANMSFGADEPSVSKPGATQPVKNEELFRKGVIGPAELSLVTSKMAVEKATDKHVKQFAEFELTEAIAVTAVLKDLGTPVPAPDAKAKGILDMLKSAKGAEFDQAYMKAQLENHLFLRDHATDYLENATSKSDEAEKQTQHLATLALATFKEHVILCKEISSILQA